MRRGHRRCGCWRWFERSILDEIFFKTYFMVMNKPFSPEPIVPILAEVGISISDLKKNPAAAVAEAERQQVAVLNRNKPVAYLISPSVWERLNDMVVDARLERLAQAELADAAGDDIEVDLRAYL